jgi:hypothetical protein
MSMQWGVWNADWDVWFAVNEVCNNKRDALMYAHSQEDRVGRNGSGFKPFSP